MKMIYRKLPKTASLPVTCHPLPTYVISLSEWKWCCPVRRDFHRYRQAMACRHEDAIILANKSYCDLSRATFQPRLWPTVFLTLPVNFTAVVIESSADDRSASTAGKSVLPIAMFRGMPRVEERY